MIYVFPKKFAFSHTNLINFYRYNTYLNTELNTDYNTDPNTGLNTDFNTEPLKRKNKKATCMNVAA